MKAPIKNPTIFRATLPSKDEALVELAKMTFTEMPESSTLIRSYGFTSNKFTGELISGIASGYSFTFRLDEKQIPKSAIEKAVKTRLAKAEANGTEFSKKEIAAIKEEVINNLAERAFVKTSVVDCFYNASEDLLFVGGSRSIAALVVSSLIKAVGTVKTTTIHYDGVKVSLTNSLRRYIESAENGDDGMENAQANFAGLEVSGDLMVTDQDTGERYSFSGIDVPENEELKAAIERGYLVDSVLLRDKSGVKFVLTSEFNIRSLRWPKVVLPDHVGDVNDVAHNWRNEAGSELLILSSIINRLCVMITGEDDAETEVA